MYGNKNGIYVWLDGKTITGFRINLNVNNFALCNTNFQGQILINNREINDIKWENDEYNLEKEFKMNNFNIYLENDSKFLTIELPKEEVKEKNNKYEIKHLEEPILEFDNFNFKLCIIQELMYEKNVLSPEFDVYEFSEEYEKRKINIDEEGYGPIQEVIDWFKKLEIPCSLASYIKEIEMDGGNDIYSQIIPFWDGEDDYFDVNDISEREIKQFPNLKKMTIFPSKDNSILIDKLKNWGIEAGIL